MLKSILIALVVIGCLISCETSSKNQPMKLAKAWHTQAEFVAPESVIYDRNNECIYVSNGVGFAKNGQGFISKLSTSGNVLSLNWITDLNRPTGMAIRDNQLFVADIDVLLWIDLEGEKVIKQFKVVEENPMLNDVDISSNGTVYVTASGSHSVYELKGDTLVKTFQEEKLLQYANGIVAKDTSLIIAGWEVATIPLKNAPINAFPIKPQLTDFDGLALDEKQNLYVTQVGEGGKLWQISSGGETTLIFEQANYLADFDFTVINGQKVFLLATGNHHAKTYGVLALTEITSQ